MTRTLRLAAVTGAGQGLGRGIALRLADTHDEVALLDLKGGEETARLIAKRGGTARSYTVDVADEASATAVFEEIEAQQGTPTALVNAAGVFLDRPFLETSAADWDRIMSVNSRGPFLIGREAARRMRGDGGAMRVQRRCPAADPHDGGRTGPVRDQRQRGGAGHQSDSHG
jgi:NAD(P)-dependent dehydrogenase (short-subunit alcohol dehydrogenase family)